MSIPSHVYKEGMNPIVLGQLRMERRGQDPILPDGHDATCWFVVMGIDG